MENILKLFSILLLFTFCRSVYNFFIGRIKSNPSKIDNSNINNTPQLIDTIPLSEKYPGLEDEELYLLLERKEENEELLSNNEKEFLKEYGWVHLGLILHREHTMARNNAIVALIENQYVILPDEYGNPHKEIVNFALQFYNEKLGSPNIEIELKQLFPIMHSHILNFITGKQQISIDANSVDIQQGFNEFSDFVVNYFTKLSLKTKKRDALIRQYFKIMHQTIIQEINKREE
jgi:hypothetical protein